MIAWSPLIILNVIESSVSLKRQLSLNFHFCMSSILLEIKKNIAFVTFNRPEKFNAFNREMALAFQKVLDDCENDSSIRCVYLTGAGKAFCAGQDLSEISN